MIRIVEMLGRFCSKFDLSILHRSEPRSLSSMWTRYVTDINVVNIPRPADESAKFQNIPAARGSLTNGRLAKGEMLGAGSGDDPLYTGLWAQPAHRRCHPRYMVGLLHYAS